MRGGNVFDFVRVNVEARNDNQVFFTVDQLEPAFFVHHGDVACGKEAARIQYFGRFFGAVPIAFHHLRAAYPHFARLSLRYLVAVGIAQFDFGGGDRQTDAAGVGGDV